MKLSNWYKNEYHNSYYNITTLRIQNFLDDYKNEKFPGLGCIKKYSLMHHFELMSNYLLGDND